MFAIHSNCGNHRLVCLRENASAATAPPIRDLGGESRARTFLAWVFRRIGQMLERHRQAEVLRRNSPLSLDDAWIGGWYARSRILQEAMLQRECSKRAGPLPRRQDWDDKLD
jgi:hypothetical protein